MSEQPTPHYQMPCARCGHMFDSHSGHTVSVPHVGPYPSHCASCHDCPAFVAPPEAAVPSPSVDEARATFWNHVYGGTSFMENERGKAAMDALVAAVRREEREQAEARVQGLHEAIGRQARQLLVHHGGLVPCVACALAAPGTPDSAGTEERA